MPIDNNEYREPVPLFMEAAQIPTPGYISTKEVKFKHHHHLYWDNVDNILYFVCANRIQNYKSGLLIVMSQVISQQKRWNSNLFWLHHLRVDTMLTISYIICALGISYEKDVLTILAGAKSIFNIFCFLLITENEIIKVDFKLYFTKPCFHGRRRKTAK